MKAYLSPPDNFKLTPKLDESTGTRRFYRFNPEDHSSSLYFSKSTQFRFDDPDEKFGVLYAATQPDAAFAETYGHDTLDMRDNIYKLISKTELSQRRVFELKITALRLAMFCGEGLPILNLDGNICMMPDYRIPQQWAQWTFQHHCHYDGIIYHSRHLPTLNCIALFDRAKEKIIKEKDLGSVLEYQHPRTGKTIYDIIEAQGWAIYP